MSNCSIYINRHQNAYTVRITDPAIYKANQERENKGSDHCAPWRDDQVSYSFETTDEVVDFVKSTIDKALVEDEFSATFDKAAKEVMK